MNSSRNHRVFLISLTVFQVLALLISSCGRVGDETMDTMPPTPLPTDTALPEQLPNLVIKQAWIGVDEMVNCLDPVHPQYLAFIEIMNEGEADAGTFHVLINENYEEVVSSLKHGESVTLEFTIEIDRLQVSLDPHDEVIEENEMDNFHEVSLDSSSLPVCTPDAESITSPPFSVFPLLPADVSISINQVKMFNESAGWGIGEAEKDIQHILRTDDGGSTWLDVTPPEIMKDSGVTFMRATACFMDVNRAWVTFQSDPHEQPGIVWHTDDAGLTWRSGWERIPGMIGSASSWPVFDFMDDETGWMLINHFVGSSTYEAELFRTQDGGRTWEQIQNDQVKPWVVGSVGGLDFIDTSMGMLTSTNPLQAEVYVYWTRDGGKYWIEQKLTSPDTNRDLFNLLFCGVSTPRTFTPQESFLSVYCYNEDGLSVPYLYTSGDNGNTWKAYPFPGTFKGTSIDILAPNLIFILGRKVEETAGSELIEKGELYRSVDGGKRWSSITTVDWYGPIHFIDGQLGWGIARGQEGTSLLHTDDGGLTWRDLQPRTTIEEIDVRMVVPPGGIVLPDGLVPLISSNIETNQPLDVQIPSLVSDLSFSSDGKTLILSQQDGWIVQWPVMEFTYPLAAYRHSEPIIDTDVALDGVTVASASEDGTIWVWFMGSPIQFLIDMGGREASSLALSPNGNTLAIALEDGSLELWDLSEESGRNIGSFTGDTGQYMDVVFSNDGQQLAAASSEGHIVIWNPTTGQQLSRWVGHATEVTQLIFAPDGLSLASISKDGDLKIWDLSSLSEEIVLKDDLMGIRSIALSPDGSLLAAGSEDGNLYLWDIVSGELMEVLRSAGDPFLSVVFSPSGDVIAAASQDGFIRFWGVQASNDSTVP